MTSITAEQLNLMTLEEDILDIIGPPPKTWKDKKTQEQYILFYGQDDYIQDDDTENNYNRFLKNLEAKNIVMEFVTQVGGQWEEQDIGKIYSFTRGDTTTLAKFEGYHSSMDGDQFCRWYFCEAVDKLVRFYEKR